MTQAREPTRARVTTQLERFDSSAITRVVTRARVGFRARVTYFELEEQILIRLHDFFYYV